MVEHSGICDVGDQTSELMFISSVVKPLHLLPDYTFDFS